MHVQAAAPTPDNNVLGMSFTHRWILAAAVCLHLLYPRAGHKISEKCCLHCQWQSLYVYNWCQLDMVLMYFFNSPS